MADSHPPLKLNSIVQVTLKEKFVDVSTTRRGAFANSGRTPKDSVTKVEKTFYCDGYSFDGRLTGLLENSDGVSYFRVVARKGVEWHLDSRNAEVAPIRVPEPVYGKDGAS